MPGTEKGYIENRATEKSRLPSYIFPRTVKTWLGWAYLTKKMPHAATTPTPIATAFKMCMSHRKNGLLNRLPEKVSFPFFD
jgi:hypothetical protein